MTETIEIVIAGAGPAGLRAAQVLASAGRDVLVVERNSRVGPKTCAGGLSVKAVRELSALGLPGDAGLTTLATVAFGSGREAPLHPDGGLVRTIPRARLGALQASWARAAGASIVTGTELHDIDPAGRTAAVGGRRVRYTHLIGADGSSSRVRRALGLPISRSYFAGEFNVPGRRTAPLLVAFDPRRLASGYFWVFPHCDYTSIGAGAPTRLVRPAVVRRYLEERIARLGIDAPLPPFEAATIETRFAGFHFDHGVHLAGDAAGVASAVTGEGIYAALITGEEVARQILEPSYPAPKTRAWMRVKRAHDAIGRAWLSRPVREASLGAIHAALNTSWSQRWTTALFVG
jgi:geranylgeranyl reductase